MKLTHHGHACVTIHSDAGDSILIDPGSLAADLTGLARPGAILITHKHEDHLDPAQLVRVAPDGDIAVFAPADAQEEVRGAGVTDVRVLAEGAVEGVPGFTITAFAQPHEVIHPVLPLPENIALTIEGRIHHPGDSLRAPEGGVDVLLLPIGAPWLKLSEVIDFARAVAPRVVIPIHQGGLAEAHRRLHIGLLTKLASEGTTVVVPEIGVPVDL